MSPINKSKCAIRVITKKKALPPLIHHLIVLGFSKLIV
jgi:hypothetical protein